MKLSQKIIIIIVGVFAVVILASYVLLSGSKKSSPPELAPLPKTSSEPTTPPVINNSPPLGLPTPSSSSENKISRVELINLLPVTNTIFDIEYLSTSDMILVTIKESPYSQSRLQAEQWFGDRGVDNFESYTIKWTQERYVD